MRTLLVDGDNLFKIGFHGVKDLFVEGNHIGGVFHFLNTLRRQLDRNGLGWFLHYFFLLVYFWDETRQLDAPLPPFQRTAATFKLHDRTLRLLTTWLYGRLHVRAVRLLQLLLIWRAPISLDPSPFGLETTSTMHRLSRHARRSKTGTGRPCKRNMA